MIYDYLIITPTFHRDALLLENLDSVKNQKYKSYIQLVVDDAASESTRSLIENYNNEHIIYLPRIRSENDLKTSCNALNFGLKFVEKSGNQFLYLKILHDDDLLYKGVLERHASILQNKNVGMVIGKEIRMDEVGKSYEVKGDRFSTNPDWIRIKTLANYIQYTSITYLYEYFMKNKSYTMDGWYRTHICYGEDKDITARYLKLMGKLGKTVVYDDNICSVYRKSGSDRITSTITENKRREDIKDVIRSNTTTPELLLVAVFKYLERPLHIFPRQWRKNIKPLHWMDEKFFHCRKNLDYSLIYWWR